MNVAAGSPFYRGRLLIMLTNCNCQSKIEILLVKTFWLGIKDTQHMHF